MSISRLLNLIIKCFLVFVLIFLLYCTLINRKFGMAQVNKVIGVYYIHVGDKALKKHNMQKAINAYQTGLNKFPGHYEAWLNLGNIYVAYEDYYSATKAYENAILAKNNYTPARMNLGIITAEKLGNFDNAIVQYKSIISAKHRLITIPFVFDNKKSETANIAIAYYNMGRAYSQKAFYTPKEHQSEKTKLLRNAAAAYENAIKIVKNNYEMFYNLALTYHLLGDYNKAGLNYCKAIDLSPMEYEAHYNLGLLLKHIKKPQYAVDELEKAVVLSTGNISKNSNYIFEILNLVSMDAKLMNEENINLQNETEDINKQTQSPEISLSRGKIVISEEDDEKILESFRKCNSKVLFESK